MLNIFCRQAPIGDNNYLLLATRSLLDPAVTLRNYDSWTLGSTSSMPAVMPVRSCSSFRSPKSTDQESNVYTILKYDYSPSCHTFDSASSKLDDSFGKRHCDKKDIHAKKGLSQMSERVWSSWFCHFLWNFFREFNFYSSQESLEKTSEYIFSATNAPHASAILF